MTGNTAASGGGIYHIGGAVSIPPGSVTGNTPNNCAGQAVSQLRQLTGPGVGSGSRRNDP